MRKMATIVIIVFANAALTGCSNDNTAFCEVQFKTEITGEINYQGTAYKSRAVYYQYKGRNSWQGMTNCRHQQIRGNLLVWKLKSDQVVLQPTKICPQAFNGLDNRQTLDLVKVCPAMRPLPELYLVDSATNPKYWRVLTDNDGVQVESVIAKRTRKRPSDELENIAPGLLLSSFIDPPNKRMMYDDRISQPWRDPLSRATIDEQEYHSGYVLYRKRFPIR